MQPEDWELIGNVLLASVTAFMLILLYVKIQEPEKEPTKQS